jgi:amino acid permease
MWLMPFYSPPFYLRQIPAFTQVLGCSWRWHEVDRLLVSLDWLTKEVFLCLHYCELNSLSMCCFLLLSRTGLTTSLVFLSVALGFSCLTFLTTIWGQGVVFIWLLNTIGISSLLVWVSIGVISLRFRQAYKAQGLSLADLPYQQPFYPLLPIGVIVLGTLMFIALGYASVRQVPFDPRVSTMVYINQRLIGRRSHTFIFFKNRTWLQLTLASLCISFYFSDI